MLTIADLPVDDPVFKRVIDWKWKYTPDAVITSKIISQEIYYLESIRGANMYDMVRAHKLVNDLKTVLSYIIKKEEPSTKLKKWWFI